MRRNDTQRMYNRTANQSGHYYRNTPNEQAQNDEYGLENGGRMENHTNRGLWARGGDEDFAGVEEDYGRHGNGAPSQGAWGGNGNSRGSGFASSGMGSQPRHYAQGGRYNHFNQSADGQTSVRRTQSWYDDKGHFGKGPKGYKRSDERIKEDVSEALRADFHVDASDIEVEVKEGLVYLRGFVGSREAKRAAEDCVHDLSGVNDVQNELTINKSSDTGKSTNMWGGDVKSKPIAS